MQTPNASRWNIGRVGDPTGRGGIGHVDFMLFVSFLVALGTQGKRDIQWNTGLTLHLEIILQLWFTPMISKLLMLDSHYSQYLQGTGDMC